LNGPNLTEWTKMTEVNWMNQNWLNWIEVDQNEPNRLYRLDCTKAVQCTELLLIHL